jgi:GNAT superfamily N-acetyltransferase
LRCYLAAPPGMSWSSIGWFAYGPCFVRGMGFFHDFGNEMYLFGLHTLEEARRKGLMRLVIASRIKEAIEHGSTTIYSLVEFTNHYALSFHLKFGYRIFLKIDFIKLLGSRINWVKNLDTKKTQWRFFFIEPHQDVKVI